MRACVCACVFISIIICVCVFVRACVLTRACVWEYVRASACIPSRILPNPHCSPLLDLQAYTHMPKWNIPFTLECYQSPIRR